MIQFILTANAKKLGIIVVLAALCVSAFAKPSSKSHLTPAVSTSTVSEAVSTSLTPADIDRLASAGTPQLALAYIKRLQPSFKANPAGWAKWEKLKITTWASQQDWGAILKAQANLPAQLPVSISRWINRQAAQAALALGRGRKALALLRPLIWRKPVAPDLSMLMSLVIRAYLVDNDLVDAHRALQYYRIASQANDSHWRLVEAQVLLQLKQPKAAMEVLAGLKKASARPYMLLAELRAHVEKATRILHLAASLAERARKAHKALLAYRLTYVEAAAASQQGNPQLSLSKQMQALAHGPASADEPPFHFDANDLWKSLSTKGMSFANQEQLILGDIQPWLKAARTKARKAPEESLAILAAAGLSSPTKAARNRALLAFSRLLAKQADGSKLLLTLFTRSKHFSKVASIPPSVRYELVNPAVKSGRLSLASKLLAGLNQPPKGIDAADWQLQRARLFLLGGQGQLGVQLLKKLTVQTAGIPAKKLLPLIFNLETLGREQEAIGLLQYLMAEGQPKQGARHLWYWLGEAYDDEHHPLKAARAYMEAATLGNPYSMDQWAKSARYQAAAALTEAGLYNDARNLYQGLLNATQNSDQQALLRQKLQSLTLKESQRRGRR